MSEKIKGGFSGANKVIFEDGTTKQLYDLKEGDIIKCVNSDGNQLYDQITKIEVLKDQKDIFCVGDIICQRTSEFYNPDLKKTVIAADLKANDQSSILILIEDKLTKISNVFHRRNPIARDLYRITTKNNYMFILNDVIVK